MNIVRILGCACLWLFPLTGHAQTRQHVPAPSQENSDFGSKFFDDLRSLFGKLQQSELARAFDRAKPIRCSDLAGRADEWKEVSFLNDDRSLGDWHYESIDEVRQDLVSFVFSGTCRGEEGSLRVATSFPVTESLEDFQQRKIPFSKIMIYDNDAVSVIFDRPTGAYTFRLPYVYSERKNGTDVVYTLTPPRKTSTPEPGVAIEFRCKALSDADLTYRFLLCRNQVLNGDTGRGERNVQSSRGSRAYYILSDGKEASSSVKLDFGADVAPPPKEEDRTSPAPQKAKIPDATWQPALADARLTYIADDEFRLRFNADMWKERIDKPQLLADGVFSTVSAAPPRNKEYCLWRPGVASQVSGLIDTKNESFGFSLEFRKDLQSSTSSIFEIQGDNGVAAATLQCYFPQIQNPSGLTVGRWSSIAGKLIELQIRKR